jgi:protein associated with RNAse G/E
MLMSGEQSVESPADAVNNPRGEYDAAPVQPGDSIVVRALKADGHAYRWWTATVESVDDTSIVTLSRVGHQVHGPKGGWISAFDVRTIYWFDRPYNLVELYLPNGDLKEIYVHIASPARLEGDALCYTDHELDVVWHPGRPPRVVDEREFCAAARQYGYSPEFQKKCRSAAGQALRLVRRWKVHGPPCDLLLDRSSCSHFSSADGLEHSQD